MTAKKRPQDVVVGLEAGADDFLIKPVNFEELRARVRVGERIIALETELARWKSHLECVLANIESGVLLSDSSGNIVFANESLGAIWKQEATEAVGVPRQAFLRRHASRFQDPEQFHTVENASGPCTLGLDFEFHSPERLTVRWKSQQIETPDGEGRLDTFIDVTAEAELARVLRNEALTDSLTGLVNRRSGEAALVREVSRAHRHGTALSLGMLDVDHFKQINDAFGHSAGDAVLRAVASIVLHSIRQYDSAVRWGGEEIFVILPGAGATEAVHIIDRIRRKIEAFAFDSLPRVTISAGVDEWVSPEPDSSAALRRADAKLYDAKAAGRNRVR